MLTESEVSPNDSTIKQRRNYKLEAKMRKYTQLRTDLLANLPEGFIHEPIGQAMLKNEHNDSGTDQRENSMSESDPASLIPDDTYLGKNRVRAGDFLIDLEEISMCGLVRMRKLLPREAY